MSSIARRLALAGLVASMVIVWGAGTDQDVAVAQAARAPIKITRIYTGSDGLSHAEEINMPDNIGGNFQSVKVEGAQFSSRPPSPGGDWHTGPRRQYVITLAGSGELEVADGVKIPVGPGHINLIEDTTGKGHITRNFGPGNRVVLTLPLID